MTSIDHEPMTTAGGITRKPLDSEIDVYGLTHQGLVARPTRTISSLAPSTSASTSSTAASPRHDNISGEERLAFIMMVADGVGGTEHGEAASRLAVESVSNYVSEAMRCYYGAQGDGSETSLAEVLEQAARSVPRERLPACRGADHQEHGHHPHPVPRRLALDLPPPGRRFPLLPAEGRRAHPGHPRPDHGAGTHGPGGHGAGRGIAVHDCRTCCPVPSAARVPCPSSPGSPRVAQRAPALQRRPYPARLRRPHSRGPLHHDHGEGGLRDAAAGSPRRRRHRQHHHRDRACHPRTGTSVVNA